MTFEEIGTKANELVAQLGVGKDIQGLADEAVSYGNYRKIMGEYQQIMNDALVLIREIAQNLQPSDNGLPKTGTFDNG